MFEPNGHEGYLKHERYHHADKGCDIRLIPNCNGMVTEKYCNTHGIVCSRTGWEIGYFQGTNSKEIYALGDRECEDCGCYIVPRKHLCKTCLDKRLKEQQKRYWEKQPNKIRSNRERPMHGKKITELLGLINEYQKADYKDRIYCDEYNQLVRSADQLIKYYLRSKNKYEN